MSESGTMDDCEALREYNRLIYQAIQYYWANANREEEVNSYILRCNSLAERLAKGKGIGIRHSCPQIPWFDIKRATQALAKALDSGDARTVELTYRACFASLHEQNVIVKLLLPDEMKTRIVAMLGDCTSKDSTTTMDHLLLPTREQNKLLSDLLQPINQLVTCLGSIQRIDSATWAAGAEGVDQVADTISAAKDLEMWSRSMRSLNRSLGLAEDDHVIKLDAFQDVDSFTTHLKREKLIDGLARFHARLTAGYPNYITQGALAAYAWPEEHSALKEAREAELFNHARSAGRPPPYLDHEALESLAQMSLRPDRPDQPNAKRGIAVLGDGIGIRKLKISRSRNTVSATTSKFSTDSSAASSPAHQEIFTMDGPN